MYGWISVNQHLEVNMSNNNQIPTALEFLHRDESGVFNEVDITQAMIDFAKLHVEAALTAVGNKIIGPAAGSVKDIYPLSNIK